MKMKSLFLCLIFFVSRISSALANEGMWLPIFLSQLNEKEMRAAGMKLKASDIYDINKGSLKDAIVLFGGGCTGEVVSDKGLLFTNHHCGYGQIQSHSTVERNYLKDGFWSKSMAEELPCPGLSVTFISRIEEVTQAVFMGVKESMTEAARQKTIDENISKLKPAMNLAAHEDLVVRSFFTGNRYFAFVTVTYTDIRLVGAPPESIGKYGSDTDNWVWPRHTGDFSVFRIYAGADNLPSAFSGSNVAYKPKHFLPISLKGIKEGDFTMVFGFPGRTDEYLTGAAVAQTAQVINPLRVELRDRALKIMDSYMRTDEATKIKYAGKYAGIANSWKKWLGESQGIAKTNGLERKNKYESDFNGKVVANADWKAKYGNLTTDLSNNYKNLEIYALNREAFSEVFSRLPDAPRLASQIQNLINTAHQKGAELFKADLVKFRENLPGFYTNYDANIDREMFLALIKIYRMRIPIDQQPGILRNITQEELDKVWQNSAVWSKDKLDILLGLDPEAVEVALENDPLVNLVSECNNFFIANIMPKYNEYLGLIGPLQRKYMQAQIEVFKERKFYPDANGTMRVSFGQVKSYAPRDAVQYEWQTDIDGVVEKYIPGDYEFDLSSKYLDLYKKRDFGRYASNGTLPICFIGSNHTTGGNSGSPAIDAKGRLIGINFDRVWEGTMSDLNYDASICRNIMVDVRYVLWVIEKYGGAGHLIEEMKIVE